MPAPSSMLGRQNSLNSSNNNRNESINFNRDANGNSVEGNQSIPSVPNPTGDSLTTSTTASSAYDEIFVSKPVSETKTMLWEIKDFNTVFSNRCERAMNFEFEVGRLGTMERHLPRRSRWKVMFDGEEVGSLRTPALRVLQLSPENKTLFYKLEAWILERTNEEGILQDKETDFHLSDTGYKEGQSDSESFENIFPIQSSSNCGHSNFLDQIVSFLHEGSLFIKVKIEILEDASTH